jgi:hypothetical protein
MAMPADPSLAPMFPIWEGQFDTFSTWVNKAPSWLSGDIRGQAVCIDMKGRRCSCGGDFSRARDDDAFPVRFFWEMSPGEPRLFEPARFGVG